MNFNNKIYFETLTHFLKLHIDRMKEDGIAINSSLNLGVPLDYHSVIEYAIELANPIGNKALSDKQIKSIFSAIGNSPSHFYMPLSSLNFEKKDFFPSKELQKNTNHKLEMLWIGFEEEYNRLILNKSTVSSSETLLQLMWKYFCNVPAVGNHTGDISLYDQVKTTAAFAVSMQLAIDSGMSLDNIKKNELPFILVGGDISGIQNYIYSITSKNAAKNLKGRSLYIQLLVDSVVKQFQASLKLFDANIVYSSGGGFYMIAPNTHEIKIEVEKLERKVNNLIFKHHRNNLFFAVDYSEVQIANLKRSQVNKTWSILTEKLANKKRKRYVEEFCTEEGYGKFFAPFGQGGEIIIDAITGEEIIGKGVFIKGLGQINAYTNQQIDLGATLRDVRYLITSDNKIKELGQSFCICELGTHYYFKHDIGNIDFLKYQDTQIGVYNISDTNNTKFYYHSNANIKSGIYLYGGNRVPITEKGLLKTFNQYASSEEKNEDCEESFIRLGVLRMDIDFLGQVFIRGFNDGQMTFSRYSALSRNLDYYFKGYLNSIRNKKEYKDNVLILYSGGDDLFIIGKWSNTINIAEEIRNNFMQWIGGNNAITLSGGMAIVDEKFPILRAAYMSEEAEKQAKNYTYKLRDGTDREKNAFSLLKVPIDWDTEFKLVKDLKETISYYVTEEVIPSSFISRISLWEKEANTKEKEIQNLQIIIWATNYLSDMAERVRKVCHEESEHAASFICKIIEGIYTNKWEGKDMLGQNHFLELVNLSSRWAELELRTK